MPRARVRLLRLPFWRPSLKSLLIHVFRLFCLFVYLSIFRKIDPVSHGIQVARVLTNATT